MNVPEPQIRDGFEVYGKDVRILNFDSAARYYMGAGLLQGWHSSHTAIGSEEARAWLRAMGRPSGSAITQPSFGHPTYSVVWKGKSFDLAVSADAEWDASFRTWATVRFDDLFAL